MKTIRTIAFILFLCATAFGVMLTLHYLPIPEILPSLRSPPGSPHGTPPTPPG